MASATNDVAESTAESVFSTALITSLFPIFAWDSAALALGGREGTSTDVRTVNSGSCGQLGQCQIFCEGEHLDLAQLLPMSPADCASELELSSVLEAALMGVDGLGANVAVTSPRTSSSVLSSDQIHRPFPGADAVSASLVSPMSVSGPSMFAAQPPSVARPLQPRPPSPSAADGLRPILRRGHSGERPNVAAATRFALHVSTPSVASASSVATQSGIGQTGGNTLSTVVVGTSSIPLAVPASNVSPVGLTSVSASSLGASERHASADPSVPVRRRESSINGTQFTSTYLFNSTGTVSDGSGETPAILSETFQLDITQLMAFSRSPRVRRLEEQEALALPRVRFDAPELQSCSICLEMFSSGMLLTRLACGHVFHIDCLAEWVRRAALCPNCRAPVAGATRGQRQLASNPAAPSEPPPPLPPDA
eukprot:TRINITY_DN12953_c0_g1_i1.p1 TRINITY_DN12953_c0_g1~~TRINITY_DN12953_c0_g1_i1.p1  ORF type:complete len:424 (-),score=54.16 TRINITY_DN12953_c0_g1_i1:205-1476(-)